MICSVPQGATVVNLAFSVQFKHNLSIYNLSYSFVVTEKKAHLEPFFNPLIFQDLIFSDLNSNPFSEGNTKKSQRSL